MVSRSRSPIVSETACWIWVTSLVTRDSSWPRGATGEEAGRLAEDVGEQRIAHVADDELADVGHPVGGQVGADALHQVDGDQHRRHFQDAALADEDVVDDVLDQLGDVAGGRAVGDHRDERRREPASIGPRVPQETPELVHAPDLAVAPPE